MLQTSKFYLFAMSFAALLAVGGCKKTVETEPVKIDQSATATIKGYVYADLDKTKQGLEFAPAGTKLILTVPYNDYSNLPAPTVGQWKAVVAVDANGQFSASIPVDANGVNVTITPLDFEADQVQTYDAYQTSLPKIFVPNAATTVVNLIANDFKIIEITYKNNLPQNFDEVVKISGKVEALFNDETSIYENVPNGTVIVFFTTDWSQSTTVTAGKYSIEIPKNVSTKYNCSFVSKKRVSDGLGGWLNVDYKYEKKNATIGTYAIETADVDINMGTGVVVP